VERFSKKSGHRIEYEMATDRSTWRCGVPVVQNLSQGGRDRCGGCTHPERAQLDAALVSGTSLRTVAKRFSISTSAAHRHKAHIPSSLVRVTPAAIIAGSNGSAPASSEDVLTSLQRLHGVCSDALEVAAESGNLLQLALASRELRAALEVLGRQIERLEQRRGAVIDLFRTTDWIETRTVMMKVLDQFPEAKRAMVTRLRELNSRSVEEQPDD
jgi:hypothetical protein